MIRLSLPALLIASFAVAAPVPKATEAEVIQKRFGTFSGAEKACSAKFADDTLTLSLKAGTAAGTGDDRKALPRFTREVAGDFTAVVRVSAELPAKAKGVSGLWTETGGGIVFIGDDGRVRCWGLHDFIYRDERMRMVPIPLGVGPVGTSVIPPKDGLFVKLARRGDVMQLAYGKDGKVWDRIETHKSFSDKPMQVGVYAMHNLNVESVVQLDQFSLTQPKEEK